MLVQNFAVKVWYYLGSRSTTLVVVLSTLNFCVVWFNGSAQLLNAFHCIVINGSLAYKTAVITLINFMRGDTVLSISQFATQSLFFNCSIDLLNTVH